MSRYADDPVDLVLDALRDAGSRVQSAGRDRWVAQCPAHDDRRPSLSVALADDRVLVHCFAGCPMPEVLDCLGLAARDLFPDAGSRPGRARGWSA